MIVDHVEDCDRRHLFRVDPSIVLARNRLVIDFEDEPERINEIDGKLFVPIPGELVPPFRWRGRNQSKFRAARSTAIRILMAFAILVP